MANNLKPTKRKGFNFLRSYFDVFNELNNDADKLSFLTAIINKQFLDQDPKELNFISNLCYESQRHSIEKSVKGYKSVTKTDVLGDPLGNPLGDPKDPTLQEEVQVQVKEKVKEKVQIRMGEFKNSLLPYLEKYGSELLNEFFLYWTEHGEKDRKMRYEKEKSFGLSRRLSTWLKNQNKFNKEKSSGKKEKIDAATLIQQKYGIQ